MHSLLNRMTIPALLFLALSYTACLNIKPLEITDIVERPSDSVQPDSKLADSSDSTVRQDDRTDDPNECHSDCNDGNICTVDRCESGHCKHVPTVGAGCCQVSADCKLESPCEQAECVVFQCVYTSASDCCIVDIECDDGQEITVDRCVNNQCRNLAPGKCVDELDCDDGSNCTVGTCVDGACVFTPNLIEECTCQRDLDCADGMGGACILQLDEDSYPAYYCSKAVGEGHAGSPCEEESDCLSGMCIDLDGTFICLGPCLTSEECHSESFCGSVNYNMEEGPVSLPACIPRPSHCFGNGDCNVGELCLPYTPKIEDEPPLQMGCFENDTTDLAEGGEECQEDEECQSDLCINGVGDYGDYCFAPCASDWNCVEPLKCYTNQAYFLFDQDNSDPTDDQFFGFSTCLPDRGSWAPCKGSTDCPAGEYCFLGQNQDRTAWELHCIDTPNPQGAAGGVPCEQDSDCFSNLCIEAGSTKFCLSTCGSPEDCAGSASCQNFPELVIEDFDDEDPGNDVTAPLDLCIP